MAEPQSRLRSNPWVALAIAFGMGSAIWLLSPLMTGRREPWDASGGYYPVGLFVSGLLAGYLCPGAWRRTAVGVFAGQAAVLLGGVVAHPGSGGLWPLGLALQAVSCLLSLLGAGIGAALHRLVGGSAPPPPPTG
jgi:hypothetical protein